MFRIFSFTSFCVLQRQRLKGRESSFYCSWLYSVRNFSFRFSLFFFRAFRVNKFTWFGRARIKVPFCQRRFWAPFFASFIELIVELVILFFLGLKKKKFLLVLRTMNKNQFHLFSWLTGAHISRIAPYVVWENF